jgi:uncharacterized caspase-like protein
MFWAVAHAVPSVDEPWRSGHAGAGAAVVVGVEDYAFLPDVPYAGRDAATMADVFTQALGLGAERVEVLRTANREQLLDAAAHARSAAAGGPVYVYFAGHGATAPDGGLLVVGDDAKADAAVFVARSVAVDELRAAAGPDAVVWLDTCWAGVGRGGEALIPGARFAVPVYALEGSGELWTAASPSEVSLPYAPARHGLFTYFLAGGLRGWADGAAGEPDGVVSTDEVWAYVERSLRVVGAAQAPRRDGAGAARTLVTGRLEPGPRLSELPAASAPVPLGPAAPSGAAKARARTGRAVGILGLVGAAASAGLTGALLAAQSSEHSSWEEYQALCAQGLRTDARCSAVEPTGSLAGPVAGVVLGVVSVGVSVTGFWSAGAARGKGGSP